MNLKDISLTEAKLILDTTCSGKNLLFVTINELVGLKAIRIVEHEHLIGKEKYVIEKAQNFDDFSNRYYEKFHKSIQENYDSLIKSDRIREPILTPYHLLEKVYRKCGKSFANYKEEIENSLKQKKLIEVNGFLWKKIKLTAEGTKVEDHLRERLEGFEELLKIDDEKKIIKEVENLGILFLLVPQLKNHISKLKKIVEKSCPVVSNSEFEMFLDVLWLAEFNPLNLDFDVFDIWNDE